MPDKPPCTRCKKIGFVRIENVVKGGIASKVFFCGACEFSWEVADDGSDRASVDPAKKGPPDRSRS
jgi:hypothetical protein